MLRCETCEQHGVLRDDRDAGAESAKAEVRDVDVVDLDGAARALDDPEQRQGKRGLAGPRPAHDADLLAAGDPAVDAAQHEVEPLPVAGLVVVELDDAVLGPLLPGVVLGDIEGGLLHDLLVLPDEKCS